MKPEQIEKLRDFEAALHGAALAARVAIDNLALHAKAIGMDADEIVERFQALIFEDE